MKKHILIAIILFVAASVLFSWPVYQDISFWGQKDWDQFTMWNAVPHKTLINYRQFPLWNPYVNGGNVMLAHPHAPFLSPFFVFVLIFGPVLGLKIQIAIHLFIGLLGMYFLAQYLKMGKLSAYFSSMIFMFCSMFPLHLTEGHTEWLAMAFVPWFFLYYLKSLDDFKYGWGGILFFSLILLNGSVDVFNIMLVFVGVYTFFKAIELRRLRPVQALMMILIGTFLLCAVKLIPMLEFLSQNPRLTEENSGVTLRILYHMLLDPDQEMLDTMDFREAYHMGLEYEWHEYGAYIGIVPLILAIIGTVRVLKIHWSLGVTGLICLLIALGSGSVINLWGLLHRLPFFDSLTVPSRFILGFILFASIAAGYGLQGLIDSIRSKVKGPQKLRYLCVPFAVFLFVFLDLYQSNSPVFENAFVMKPRMLQEKIIFQQRYRNILLYKKYEVNSSIYPAFLSNSGVLEAYEVVNVAQGKVRAMGEEGYKGEFYLDRAKGETSLSYFSPNILVYDVNLTEPNLLVVNQNFHRGWKVNMAGKVTSPVATNGLLSAFLLPGKYQVMFYYLPNSFLVGIVISFSFILFFIFNVRRKKPDEISSG